MWIGASVLVLLGVVGSFIAIRMRAAPADPTAVVAPRGGPNTATTGIAATISTKTVACWDRDSYTRMRRLITVDPELAPQMLMDPTHGCRQLEGQVVIVERDAPSGMIRVKTSDDSQMWWTSESATVLRNGQ
ncbi:MAG: hypothetical protein ABI085_20460 [Gemmatimonadaceae bacterium]